MKEYIERDVALNLIREEVINKAEQYANRNHPVVMAYGDCFGKVKSLPSADVISRSEIAREIFKEINKLYAVLDDNDDIYIGSLRIDLAELEKKYTQERESEPDKPLLKNVIKTCEEVSKESNKREYKEKDSIDRTER